MSEIGEMECWSIELSVPQVLHEENTRHGDVQLAICASQPHQRSTPLRLPSSAHDSSASGAARRGGARGGEETPTDWLRGRACGSFSGGKEGMEDFWCSREERTMALQDKSSNAAAGARSAAMEKQWRGRRDCARSAKRGRSKTGLAPSASVRLAEHAERRRRAPPAEAAMKAPLAAMRAVNGLARRIASLSAPCSPLVL